jgi:hypothetical protein
MVVGRPIDHLARFVQAHVAETDDLFARAHQQRMIGTSRPSVTWPRN